MAAGRTCGQDCVDLERTGSFIHQEDAEAAAACGLQQAGSVIQSEALNTIWGAGDDE